MREGARDLQIQQIVQDIGAALPTNVRPKDWQEVFALLDLQQAPGILCIDEFPYLAQSEEPLAKNQVSSSLAAHPL